MKDKLSYEQLKKTAERRPDLVAGGKVDMKKLQYEADAINEHEFAKFQAWAVTMPIRRSAIDIRVYETVYYLRAPEPEKAAWFAARIFLTWEKDSEFERWPDIDDNSPDGQVRGMCERMSDSDYLKAWDEANSHPDNKVLSQGNQLNPMVFTWYPPTLPWEKAPEIQIEDI